MKLSIVIPVYQVADTLPRCLDSIIDQSFRDWQGILVDDGSTDGSAAICDQYVKRDRRFQVVHLKRNSGLSTARNAGLEKVRGEYVTFLDSDDFLGKETWKTLFEILNVHPDYDILEFPVFEHYGSKHIHRLQFQRREYTDMTAYWLEGKAYTHCYFWNKIFKSELFEKVRFPVKRNFEDVQTLPKILKRCNTVATTDSGLYYYCYNAKGITCNATLKDFKHLLEAHTRMLSNLLKTMKRKKKKDKLDKYLGEYYAHIINIQLDVYDAGGKVSKYVPVLPYSHTFKLKLLHLIGLKRLCQLHKIFSRKRSSAS